MFIFLMVSVSHPLNKLSLLLRITVRSFTYSILTTYQALQQFCGRNYKYHLLEILFSLGFHDLTLTWFSYQPDQSFCHLCWIFIQGISTNPKSQSCALFCLLSMLVHLISSAPMASVLISIQMILRSLYRPNISSDLHS